MVLKRYNQITVPDAEPWQNGLEGSKEDFERLVAADFMYRPMTGDVMDRLARLAAEHCAAVYGPEAAAEVKIDDMRDLYGKEGECAECSRAESYEEYRLKRVALGLPDNAGSEAEWTRMAEYRPGAVRLNVVVRRDQAAGMAETSVVFR